MLAPAAAHRHGHLRSTTASGATTFFLYLGSELIGEYADGVTTTPLRRYVHSGVADDEPLVWYEGPAVATRRWLHADRQGSILGWSDSTGAVTASTYSPYGEPSTWSGPRFRYTGQAAFPEIQAYHYKARHYDPAMGRFLQTDPIGQEPDPNLYAYVKDDPTNQTDPTGNCPACVGALVGAALGGGLEVAKETLLEGKSLQQVSWGKVGTEALIGGVAGGTGAGAGALVAKTGLTLTALAVTGGVSSGVSSALHGDKPGAVAVKTVVGAALGPAGKIGGDKVTAALGAAPKAVPGQIVTWGASKAQVQGANLAGLAASKGIPGAGNAATSAGCKEQGSCK